MSDTAPAVQSADWNLITASPSAIAPLAGQPAPAPGARGLVERFLADGPDSAAPHSWLTRPQVAHPLAAGREQYAGWLSVSGNEHVIAILDAVLGELMDTGETGHWREYVGGGPLSLPADTITRAVAHAELLAEADRMNEGFIVRNYGDSIELRMNGTDSLKGLEAVIAGYEQLGLTVSYQA